MTPILSSAHVNIELVHAPRIPCFVPSRISLRFFVASFQQARTTQPGLRRARPKRWRSHPNQVLVYSQTDINGHPAVITPATSISTRSLSEGYGLPPCQQTLLEYVKDTASRNAVRRMVNTIEEAENGNGPWGNAGIRPDSATYRTAIRALLKANRTDLAILIYRQRMNARVVRPGVLGSDFPLASSVIKAVLRDCKKRGQKALHAADILQDMLNDCDECEVSELPEAEDIAVSRMLSALLSVTAALLNDGNLKMARNTLRAAMGVAEYAKCPDIPIGECNNLIRLLGKKNMVDQVFDIFDFIRKTGGKPNNETFEFLANATVKQVQFVTGAVSMSTLPEALAAEVAFAGRSNVGKSSLVNMLCNRKALAYVSGRPGKTQQFNYFLVNERIVESQFYLVDMPGVGYAKVPKTVQNAWMKFMGQYFRNRTSLRLVFHLVDGRHGALADDEELMAQISETERARDYVIVLTKMDKVDKQKAKQSILDNTRAALVRNGCPASTPIVLTSSSSKLGREEMWRQMRAALQHLSVVKDE